MLFSSKPIAKVPVTPIKNHRIIGLTGSLGAGKSEALQFLESHGIPTLQTDQLGHKLLKEKLFRDRLVSRFGRDILGAGNEVDRVKLGAIVFSDSRQQKRLNAIVHPEIRRRVNLWVKKLLKRTNPPPLMVVEVPLIFEGGYHRSFDGVLCISAKTKRRHRFLTKRGWTISEARRREKLQWPNKRKEAFSDWVVRNNGSLESLQKALRVWLTTMDVNGNSRQIKYFGKL